MIDIKSLNLQEMTQLLRDMGEPAFRGKQVYTWLHKGVTSFEEMSNLSKPLRAKLQEQCYTYDEMYRYLSIVGAPVKPEDVGISKSQMLADVPFVRHIRRRYNMLDLGLRAGLLDGWVEGIFGQGGIWEVK